MGHCFYHNALGNFKVNWLVKVNNRFKVIHVLLKFIMHQAASLCLL